MNNKYYTGVGSRETPIYILYMMSQIAMILEKKGYILRSGCALGADAAFEDALEHPEKNSEIYIPYEGFSYKMGKKNQQYYIIPERDFNKNINDCYYTANRIIHNKLIHKYWQNCSQHVIKLHNRNIFQILGKDLNTKSKFNICYTKLKETKYEDTTRKTGGTGTSINGSDIYDITLFNLSVDEHYLRLQKFIKENQNLINYERLNNIKPRTDLYNERENGFFVNNYSHFINIINKEKNEREKLIKKTKKNKKTFKP